MYYVLIIISICNTNKESLQKKRAGANFDYRQARRQLNWIEEAHRGIDVKYKVTPETYLSMEIKSAF